MNRLSLQDIQSIELDILQVVNDICEKHNLTYYLIGGTLLGAIRHSGFIPWDDDIDIALPRNDYDRLEAVCRNELPKHYKWIDYKDDHRLPYHFGKICDMRTSLIEKCRQDYRVRLGVYIDVFPLDGVANNRLMRLIHYGWIKTLRGLLIANYVDNRWPRHIFKRLAIFFCQRVMTNSVIRLIHDLLENSRRRYPYHTSKDICNYSGSYGWREAFPKAWIARENTAKFEGLELRVFGEYDKYLRRVYGDYQKLPPMDRRRSHHSFECFRISI